MSRKKKQAEAQAAAEALQAQQEQARVRRPSVSFRVMNNCAPVPVAKPADFIQLTPIVQPIPLVPYSSQLQPFAQFDEEEEY
ncbi:MAG: hypothetical protein WC292_07385 [Clostridia bacterium]